MTQLPQDPIPQMTERLSRRLANFVDELEGKGLMRDFER